MPILDRMFPGSEFNIAGPGSVETGIVTPQLFKNIAGFRRFKLDDDLRMSDIGTSAMDIERTFGHLRLPFPKVWIEWENRREGPEETVLDHWWMGAACLQGGESLEFFLELFGADLSKWEGEIPTPPGAHRLTDNSWQMFFFLMVNGTPTLLPMTLVVNVDDSGMFSGISTNNHAAAPGTSDGAKVSTAVDLGFDALATIGFLNCQNVTTEEVDRSANVRRRRPSRNKASSLNYNTIQLPGISSGDGTPGNKTGTMAHHMARGHFKTFTEEAPLFGKHTGTYWWGWQVRGDRNNGITVSDYQIQSNPAA